MPAVEDYVASAAALRDALDRIAEQELDSYDELSAFRVWVAREFEGAGSELAAFPSPDDGISFYLSEPSALTVYLCDSRLEFGGGSEMPVWGSEVVDRFFRALDALIAGSQQPFADKALQRVAQGVAKDLAREPDSVSLNGTLALMGELTLDARQRFEVLRRERPGMTVDVVSWVGIRERLDAQGLPPSKSFHVDLHIDSMVTDALKQRDWLVGLVYARDFVAAMERFGVQLFDLNVRNELRKSRVNKEIVKTVGRQLGRRNFHHLNNGILVACNSYSLKGNNRIRVHSPQIINGCQTVSSLHRAYLQLDEDERADFDAHVRVQVKLLQHPDPELLDQIVISTNNQNPMKPRNLRSNTVEQKAIQRSFRSLASPWFFVRKDGEFDALCGSPRANWFRRGHYQTAHGTGSARYRTLDNVLVAKDWYSWIGAAPVVLRGGNDFFGDEMLYRRVFALRPSPKHWDYFRSEEFRAIDEDLLEVGPPSASEYLLASCVAAFIRASGLSPYRNKKASLMRGVAMGALSGNLEIGHVTSSTAQQAAFLASDMEYLLNNYLNNIEDVLVELASATIASRFEGQGESVSTELLAREDVAAWCDSAFGIPFAQVAVEYPRGLLHDLATTVRTAAAAYCREHADEVSAASRPKMFLGRRETILEMRSYL